VSDTTGAITTAAITRDSGAGPAPASAMAIDATDGGVPTRLMVLGLAHRDGTVYGEELYRVATECGIPIETVRSCMRRLIGEGIFERTGQGRDAVFPVTATGRALFSVYAHRHQRSYAQDAAGRGWDRTWHLVAFAIPESRRADRDSFRDHLRTMGGAALQPGCYVSPHRWEDDVVAEADLLGITEHLTMLSTTDLSVGEEINPRILAERLWPLDEVARRYEAFIDTYREVPAHLEAMRHRGEKLSEHDFLPGALHIAIRFNECVESDPLLPPELLPRPWPGRQARELLARCRRIGVLAREDKGGPALFRVFDEAVTQLR